MQFQAKVTNLFNHQVLPEICIRYITYKLLKKSIIQYPPMLIASHNAGYHRFGLHWDMHSWQHWIILANSALLEHNKTHLSKIALPVSHMCFEKNEFLSKKSTMSWAIP